MAYLEWNDRLSVKVAEFDKHHQKLIDLINKLHDAMTDGLAKDVIGRTLLELADYTKYHFAAEEVRMKACGYQGLSDHKAEHDGFVASLVDFKAKFDAGNASSTSIKVLNFLRDWLVKHIQGTDKLYSEFFNARNVA